MKKKILRISILAAFLVLAGILSFHSKVNIFSKWSGDTNDLLSKVVQGDLTTDYMEVKREIILEEVDYLLVEETEGMQSYMEQMDCLLEKQFGQYQLYKVKNNYYHTTSNEQKIQRIMEETGLSIREIEIPLSGNYDDIKGDEIATYWVLNDLHLLLSTKDTTIDHQEKIINRYETWTRTSTGTHSVDTWQNITAIIDGLGGDGLLLAGDMVDFASSANYELFQKGLDKVQMPVLYARADHDLSPWYNSDGTYTYEEAYQAHTNMTSKQLVPMSDLMVLEEEDYVIMAWNNSTGQMTTTALQQAKEILAQNKPVFLVTHVPLQSALDNTLDEAAKGADSQQRIKLWGKDCLYVPDAVTSEFITLVTEEQSPVVAVLSGHLHFPFEVMLNQHCKEYVLAPSFAGNITKVKIIE